jgi:pyrroline-5-carboxylate reductase
MASALVRGLLRSSWNATRIAVVEPNEAQRAKLEAELSVQALSRPDALLRDAPVIVWAVKPQVLHDAIVGAARSLSGQLHVSICAGVSTSALAHRLVSRRIVRAMPNTPALVGSGVTGLFALPEVTAADRQLVESLFAPTGHSFWVDSDERIDAVTALSGSGPAYVFEFLACLQAAAQDLGFDEATARDMVVRTAAGALAQATADPSPLRTLRERVTSKGGTTAAALDVLQGQHFPGLLARAVRSAYDRAGELSREFEA